MQTEIDRLSIAADCEPAFADLPELADHAYQSSGCAVHAPATSPELATTNATLPTLISRYDAALNNITQGVCFFDGEERLILSNRRYAEIYRLAREDVQPGMTLTEIVKRRVAAGTSSMSNDDYMTKARSINSAAASATWIADLMDGRIVQICHQPMPDGGWVATHEDITELRATRSLANERLSLQTLIDAVPDYLWVKDFSSRFVVANQAQALECGRARTSDMIGLTDFDLHSYDMAQAFRATELEVLNSGRPMIDVEEMIFDETGSKRWHSSTKMPFRDDQNVIIGLVGYARDITARKLASSLQNGQARILERIAAGAPLGDVLDEIALLVEFQLSGISCVIMLVADDGTHLERGAAPSLSDTFAKASDNFRIGPKSASCGSAIFRSEPVIVSDIDADPMWEDYRHFATAHGFRSCWSTPIKSHDRRPLGTVALYARTERAPTADETMLTGVAVHLASIAIERSVADERVLATGSDR